MHSVHAHDPADQSDNYDTSATDEGVSLVAVDADTTKTRELESGKWRYPSRS
jgi:hypothetical protein